MGSEETGPVGAADVGPTAQAATERVVTTLRAAGCVFAEEEAALLVEAAAQHGGGARLDALVAQRVAGLPLEHVLGWALFWGLRVEVDPGVFVPRRRSELLVREALAVLTPRGAGPGAPPLVVDLCCGSGAVGTALLASLDGIELHAADIDPAAVGCARRNVEPRGGHAYEGDLVDALPAMLRGRVDVLVANAPYVPTDAIALMPPEAREHEARVALDGGSDGLDVLRRVVGHAVSWLAPGGHVLVETSVRQAPVLAVEVARVGLVPRVVRDDDLDGTVVVGSRARA
jgi:release factor glutamine methyltransferase